MQEIGSRLSGGSNLDWVVLQDELLQRHYEYPCKYQMCKSNAGSPFIVEAFIKRYGFRAGVI